MNKRKRTGLSSQDDVMDAVLSSITRLLTYGLNAEALRIALMTLQELIRVTLLDDDTEPRESIFNHLSEL